jgi:hypothetical protein
MKKETDNWVDPEKKTNGIEVMRMKTTRKSGIVTEEVR